LVRVIWFHGASVGESNSILPVIKKFIEKNPEKNYTVLFTSGTKSSANIISKKIEGYNIIHQYVPIDKYFVVKRFLKHWKPSIFIPIESEIWPNLFTLTKKSGCPIVLINGKMSEKSFAKWNKKLTFKKQVFSCIDLCFAQSKNNKDRFIKLGVKNTEFLGNLKFDVPPLKGNKIKEKELQNLLKVKKDIWSVASTHKGEEELIAQMHIKLKKKYPNLLTTIILRHPKRKDEVLNMLKKEYKLNVVVRTDNQKITKKTDIYLCDTFGEMGIFFRVFDIVLMAGSLVDNIGGHTPVEPAKLNCAILTGPYIYNNKGLFAELEKNDACINIKDNGKIIQNTVKQISNLFNNPKRVKQLQKNAYKLTTEMDNITDKILDEIIKVSS
jgi:3-deoxy-D-manno-octulosonic-acid transferase